MWNHKNENEHVNEVLGKKEADLEEQNSPVVS